MKSLFTTSIFTVLFIISGIAQEIPRKLIVEHFTNTRCSTCASRNPGFYANYDMHKTSDFMHLTIHPSSPYSNCVLNNQDVLGNDDRTKYYGIYGSTPRLVINGTPISASTSYNSPTIFSPYLGLTSPVQITLYQQKFGTDSIRVRAVITVVASHTLPSQSLYLVLAEDTVFYNAPNGENQHYDVFRRALNGNTGSVISIPSSVGDSVVFTHTTAAHADWDFSRIYALAVLQDSDTKEVTQAEALSPTSNSNVSVGIPSVSAQTNIKVYPTISNAIVTIESELNLNTDVRVFSITGNEVLRTNFSGSTQLNVSKLNAGIYILIIESETGSYSQKIVKY